MAFYRTCSRCGSNLDPGERCDCENEKGKGQVAYLWPFRMDQGTGQYQFQLEREEEGLEKEAPQAIRNYWSSLPANDLASNISRMLCPRIVIRAGAIWGYEEAEKDGKH